MTNDRIQHGLPRPCEPTPDEIERAMKRAEHLRARVFRDLARALAASLARTDRERKFELARAT